VGVLFVPAACACVFCVTDGHRRVLTVVLFARGLFFDLVCLFVFLTRLLDLVLRLTPASSLLRFVWLYVVVAGDCSKAKHAKPIEPLHANFHTETQMPRFKMRNLRAENL